MLSREPFDSVGGTGRGALLRQQAQARLSTTIIAFVFLKVRGPMLTDGRSGLYCSGVNSGEALPAHRRRERFLNVTGGIVVGSGHPIQGGTVRPCDLAKWP